MYIYVYMYNICIYVTPCLRAACSTLGDTTRRRPWGKVVKGVDEGDWLEPQQFDRKGVMRV